MTSILKSVAIALLLSLSLSAQTPVPASSLPLNGLLNGIPTLYQLTLNSLPIKFAPVILDAPLAVTIGSDGKLHIPPPAVAPATTYTVTAWIPMTKAGPSVPGTTAPTDGTELWCLMPGASTGGPGSISLASTGTTTNKTIPSQIDELHATAVTTYDAITVIQPGAPNLSLVAVGAPIWTPNLPACAGNPGINFAVGSLQTGETRMMVQVLAAF